MPSTQTPPIAGAVIDPTSVRPDIDDAIVERVTLASLRERLEACKSQGYVMLLDLGAVDYPQRESRFDLVYHLLTMPQVPSNVAGVGTPKRLRVLCAVGEHELVPTSVDLWRSADWAEREIFDLFGVRFEGHPDLRRIQMPHDWVGYPLRKDYPLRGPVQEQSPRPEFALKSNVQAGTPPTGRTLEALQEQVKRARAGDER